MNKKAYIIILFNVLNLLFSYLYLYKTCKIIHKKTVLRRWWVRASNLPIPRKIFGAYNQVFCYFKLNDHEEFFKMTRMSVPQFNLLYDIVEPKLRVKRGRSFRTPLSPELQLCACLSYLAHGDSVCTTSWYFRIGKSTMYKIIVRVCAAIIKLLQPLFLKQPETEEWQKISENFNKLWQMPNCIGAIDGKHCRIWAPPKSGSCFHNYKGYFSFVLLAICDANYRFTWLDIGDYGSQNDAGIWANTNICKDLDNGLLNIPPPKNLPNTNIIVPHYFIGDEAFPLKPYLMRPYSRRNILGIREKVFNYRLSRGRRIIENSFGILAARWEVLQKSIRLKLETAISIVQVLVCLHNFIVTTNMQSGGRADYYECLVDREDQNGNIINGEWRTLNIHQTLFNRLGRIGANIGTVAATQQRDILAQYFVSENGCIPWQWDKI